LKKFDTHHILQTRTQNCNWIFVYTGSFHNTASRLKQTEICAAFKNSFSLVIFML